MNLEYYAILTQVGIEAIANAVVLGKKVVITHFAVGDGGGSYYKPTKEMTELKCEKWRGKINSYEVDELNPDLINVKTILPASVGGFTIREMGIFDDKGSMIAVANTPDSVKITTDSGAVKEIELVMEFLITNTDAVTIQVNPNVATATKEDIQKHNQSEKAHEKLIARKIAESTIQRDIVIPATVWMEEIAEGGGGGVYANVEQKDVTDEMIPIVSIFRECMSIARNCGMSTTVETVNGGITFYAEKIPEQDISASLLLLRASGGSGTYINNMASDEEVQEMLNEAFGSTATTPKIPEENT